MGARGGTFFAGDGLMGGLQEIVSPPRTCGDETSLFVSRSRFFITLDAIAVANSSNPIRAEAECDAMASLILMGDGSAALGVDGSITGVVGDGVGTVTAPP